MMDEKTIEVLVSPLWETLDKISEIETPKSFETHRQVATQRHCGRSG